MAKINEYTEKPSASVAPLLAEFDENHKKIMALKSQPGFQTNLEYYRLLNLSMDLTLEIYRASRK